MASDEVTGLVVSNCNGIAVHRQVFPRSRLCESVCEAIGNGCTSIELGPRLQNHITYVDEEGIYNAPHPNVVFIGGVMWHGKIIILGAPDQYGAETNATLSPKQVYKLVD